MIRKKMKKYKCPNCNRESEVKGDVIMVYCGCGYEMKLVERINEDDYPSEIEDYDREVENEKI